MPGDIGDPAILKQLAEIAPVTAIRGNVDRDAWARKIPSHECARSPGVSIYILHNLNELDLKPEGCGIWRCGHAGTLTVAQAGDEERRALFQSGERGAEKISVAGDGRAAEGKRRQRLHAEIVEILRGQSSRALLGRADEASAPTRALA